MSQVPKLKPPKRVAPVPSFGPSYGLLASIASLLDFNRFADALRDGLGPLAHIQLQDLAAGEGNATSCHVTDTLASANLSIAFSDSLAWNRALAYIER